jgi:hypothetical protein
MYSIIAKEPTVIIFINTIMLFFVFKEKNGIVKDRFTKESIKLENTKVVKTIVRVSISVPPFCTVNW